MAIRTEEARSGTPTQFMSLFIKENCAEELVAFDLVKVVVQRSRAAALEGLYGSASHRLHRGIGRLETHDYECGDGGEGDENRHRSPEGEEYLEKQASNLLPANTTGRA